MKVLLLIAPLLFIWPWSAKEYHMTAGSNVPAASGTVTAQKDKDNGNTRLELKVNHLANPSSLTPPASVYLVWVRPSGTDAVKQGAIGVDKNLKGELKVVTLSKDFDLLVTAEQSATVTVPSNVEVLHTHIN